MKLIGKEEMNGKMVLVTETKRFLLKPLVRKFVASRQITENFSEWLELPNATIVPATLSCQLDAWSRL